MKSTRYTLIKNKRPIVFGLSRKVFLMGLESIKKNALIAGLPVYYSGTRVDTTLTVGQDTYKLEESQCENITIN